MEEKKHEIYDMEVEYTPDMDPKTGPRGGTLYLGRRQLINVLTTAFPDVSANTINAYINRGWIPHSRMVRVGKISSQAQWSDALVKEILKCGKIKKTIDWQKVRFL